MRWRDGAAVEVEVLPRRAGVDGVARERRIDARVERQVDAGRESADRPRSSAGVDAAAEGDVAPAHAAADDAAPAAAPVRRGAQTSPRAIRHLEERMLAPDDARRRLRSARRVRG